MVLAIFLPTYYQNLIGALGVLSVGILHGANDIEILLKRNKSGTPQTIHYLYKYLGVVIVSGIIFFFIPSIALLGFVLFSAYHFGEQHWANKAIGLHYPFIFQLLYGSALFFLLFTLQAQPVIEVIQTITHYDIKPQIFIIGFFLSSIYCLFGLSTKAHWQFLIGELILFCALALIFSQASLVFAFGYYFVFWHSIPSLKEQLHFLYKEISAPSLFQYLKKGAVYWIAALMGLMFLFYYVDLQADYILPLFFTFLAAITFPHAVVMYMMFKEPK